jgi:hypothetical protein
MELLHGAQRSRNSEKGVWTEMAARSREARLAALEKDHSPFATLPDMQARNTKYKKSASVGIRPMAEVLGLALFVSRVVGNSSSIAKFYGLAALGTRSANDISSLISSQAIEVVFGHAPQLGPWISSRTST